MVVVGGGFGGLYAVQSLHRARGDITLIDRRNFHLFLPLLYQVATGGLPPANIAAHLRSILARQSNARVLLGEVVVIDLQERCVHLRDRASVPYDTLVVATGATHNHFGNDHWEPLAPGLKTVEDATLIRARVLAAFEVAELETDPQQTRAWLTFLVIGAGPTGVEMAGAVAEVARDTLRHNFRTISPADAHVLLMDAADRVLPSYPPALAVRAAASLARLRVTVRTGVAVVDIQPGATVLRGPAGQERIATRTVIWAAGVRASNLGRILAAATGATPDRIGRVVVEPDLTVPGHPETFVIGDLAACADADGQPLPGIAPVAMQQGRYVARPIKQRLRGGTLPAFHYRHHGSMATIGRAAAVADLGWIRFSGYLAWLAWLFVHLMFIAEFRNRLLVLLQ